MFELKYKISESDIKSINARTASVYCLMYGCGGGLGVITGGFACAFGEISSKTHMLALGIVLVVLGCVLCCFALWMALAPKKLFVCAVPIGDAESDVIVDETGITVNGENIATFVDIKNAVFRKNSTIEVFCRNDKVFVIKDAITSGQTLAELYSYISERKGHGPIVHTCDYR